MQKQPSRFIIFAALCAGLSGAALGAASGFSDVRAKARKAAAAAPAPQKPVAANVAQRAVRAEAAQAHAAEQAEEETAEILPAAAAESSAQAKRLDAGRSESLQGQKAESTQNLRAPAALPGEEAQGVLNGYKGYRYHRPGYKSAGDGWWYPRAAFARKTARETLLQRPKSPAAAKPAATAAEKKPAAKPKPAKPRKPAGLSAAHYSFYSARDNTYGTLLNKRKTCISPYYHK